MLLKAGLKISFKLICDYHLQVRSSDTEGRKMNMAHLPSGDWPIVSILVKLYCE